MDNDDHGSRYTRHRYYNVNTEVVVAVGRWCNISIEFLDLEYEWFGGVGNWLPWVLYIRMPCPWGPGVVVMRLGQ
jgi:hypothetical protein